MKFLTPASHSIAPVRFKVCCT